MRRPLFLLVSLAACHENVTLEMPDLEGAASVLVWSYVDANLREIHAADVTVEGKLDPPIPNYFFQDRVEIFLMAFACPLDDVGLSGGPQTLLLDIDGHDDVRLPPAEQMLFAKIDSVDVSPEWQRLEEPDPRALETMLRMDLPADHVCSLYRTPYELMTTTVGMPSRTAPSFAIALDEHRILIGRANGRIFVLDDQGVSTEVEDLGLGESPRAIEFRGAFKRGDDIWLYAPDGRVARGTLEGGFEFIPKVGTATGTAISLAGSSPGEDLELFAATNRRRLSRYDGSMWREVHRGDSYSTCVISLIAEIIVPPSVAWVAPGEAVAIGVGEPTESVIRYRDGEPFLERFPTIAGNPVSLLHTEGGTYAGTCDGEIVVRDDTQWTRLATPVPTKLPVLGFTRTERGFLLASGVDLTPYVAEYHHRIGYCLGEELDGFGQIMVQAGDTVFIVLLQLRPGPMQVMILKPGPAPCFART